jgi:hypothetical protein
LHDSKFRITLNDICLAMHQSSTESIKLVTNEVCMLSLFVFYDEISQQDIQLFKDDSLIFNCDHVLDIQQFDIFYSQELQRKKNMFLTLLNSSTSMSNSSTLLNTNNHDKDSDSNYWIVKDQISNIVQNWSDESRDSRINNPSGIDSIL